MTCSVQGSLHLFNKYRLKIQKKNRLRSETTDRRGSPECSMRELFSF